MRAATMLGALSLAAALSLGAAPALAQTGYPPGPCTAVVGNQFAGNVTIGQTFSVTLTPNCVFTGAGSVSVTVNGVPVGTKTASANGTISVTVTVLSATQLSIDDPVIVPANCGTNTISATGPSTVAGGPVTQNANFTVSCPGTPFNPGFIPGVGTFPSTGFISPAGFVSPTAALPFSSLPASVVGSQPQQQSENATVSRGASTAAAGVPASSSASAGVPGASSSPASASRGGKVAFTGTNIFRSSVVGLLLIALGTSFLVVRRRRAATA